MHDYTANFRFLANAITKEFPNGKDDYRSKEDGCCNEEDDNDSRYTASTETLEQSERRILPQRLSTRSN
jgi:hypothetical protein